MVDEGVSAFDAVEQGPQASEGDAGTPRENLADGAVHPSVTALQGRFNETVLRNNSSS